MSQNALAQALPAVHATNNLARDRRLLTVLFFFSGFPALMYQLVWQRALFRILGVNIESVTIVVTAFMLGLGLGSLAGGWLSRRRGIPLLLILAAIELATASFGLVSLDIFNQVGELVLGSSLPLTVAVTLAMVIVPTLLMGATLPVLVGYLARRSGNVGDSIGTLYYVNTLGAGASCLVCIALFFPFLGMRGTVAVAAVINSAVAAGALFSYFRGQVMIPYAEEARAATPTLPILPFASVLGLAFLGGLISLSYEIFLFRTMSFATGSNAAAFAATLGAFLIGLASGSRCAAESCSGTARDAMRQLLRALLLANVIGSVMLSVLEQLAWLDRGLLGLVLLMTYLLARGWGGLLPAVAHLGVVADEHAGMRSALVYLANILGAVGGSVLTGFVLMDKFGLVAVSAILSGAGWACLGLIASILPLPRHERVLRVGGVVVACAFAIVMLPRYADGTLEALQRRGSASQTGPFTHTIENRSGIITVDRDGTVFGHGMYDGKFNTDLIHDTNGIIRPFALSLFHSHPRNVLMIGLSTGSWAQVLANNPEVESLTIVEINPGYTALIAQNDEVKSVLRNSKVKLIVDDGRRWLRLNPDQRFDAIVSNTTYHFRANASNLLSVEFLELVRRHLQPGGIFFFNTTDSLRVQRTACQVFPYGARFTNHIVVSDTPLDWDGHRWMDVLERYRIDGRPVIPMEASAMITEKVNESFGPPAVQSPAREDAMTEACQAILVRSDNLLPITDDNMGTEWRYPLGLE